MDISISWSSLHNSMINCDYVSSSHNTSNRHSTPLGFFQLNLAFLLNIIHHIDIETTFQNGNLNMILMWTNLHTSKIHRSSIPWQFRWILWLHERPCLKYPIKINKTIKISHFHLYCSMKMKVKFNYLHKLCSPLTMG